MHKQKLNRASKLQISQHMKNDPPFTVYPFVGKGLHKAIVRGVEHDVADWTREEAVNWVGKLLDSCELFGLDPMAHLGKVFPRITWRVYNTDGIEFDYTIALNHMDLIFFIGQRVVTGKWRRKNPSHLRHLGLCWVNSEAEIDVGIQRAIEICNCKRIPRIKQ